jgi:hypothetical protein
MAVAVVEDESGKRFTLIGTSEKRTRTPYVRPGVVIQSGETVVTGVGDAEANIVAHAKKNNLKVIAIGATKKICSDCEAAIKPTGATIATPLIGAPNRSVQKQMAAKASKGLGRGLGGLSVYISLREAAQAAGIAQPDYVQIDAPYYFTTKDGSVYIVQEGGWFSSFKYRRLYVAGPRAGETETMTTLDYERALNLAHSMWGRYVPGSLFHQPRFIPGMNRSSIPLIELDTGRKIGFIDEDGVHRYNPRELDAISPIIG